MKVGEGEGGMLELSRMGMGLLDEIVSLGALAEKSRESVERFSDVFRFLNAFFEERYPIVLME